MSPDPNTSARARALLLLGCLIIPAIGCISTEWAKLRDHPVNPLSHQLALDSRRGPQPTQRTLQMLRKNDLVDHLDGDPELLLAEAQSVANAEPTAEHVYAIAELAYVAAKKVEAKNQPLALDMYGTAVANAYLYLFDESYQAGRNPYDPRFRRACDLYNNSLENALRYVQSQGQLKPGGTHVIRTSRQAFDVDVAVRGTWHEEHFGDLKFASDFEVKEFTNHNKSYGLGVPMIAVYKNSNHERPDEKFYPPGMSFPVTAFLRVMRPEPGHDRGTEEKRHRCVIELHDPLKTSEISVGNQIIPLETDLTTPLAYSLDNPLFKKANVATRGVHKPEKTMATSGLYMLEPYDASKIPVVMIHGFWSSLVTWMEMFNDLRGSPEIRKNYQFWFYLYPTGTPYWFTASNLREQLAMARQSLDPNRESPSLDKMVLVGHSMGGLMAQLQTMESGNEFWSLISEQPLDSLLASPEVIDDLRQTFFFQPNHSIRRVVSIASPFHGSNFSNMATQWLGRKFINIPEKLAQKRDQLIADNPGYFKADHLLEITTAVDGLAPESPMIAAMQSATRAPWVQYHNVIGDLEEKKVLGSVAGGSDGVVTTTSAHLDGATSELIVSGDHITIHRNPKTILEVRRILLEHLRELQFDQPIAVVAGAAESH